MAAAPQVLGFAYGRDACAMRQTSSFFQTLAEDNILWRTIFLRTFPFCFEASRSQTNWRSAFANQIGTCTCVRVRCVRVSCRTEINTPPPV
jgi:hypothetical protein